MKGSFDNPCLNKSATLTKIGLLPCPKVYDYVVLTLFEDFSLGSNICSCTVPHGCPFRGCKHANPIHKRLMPTAFGASTRRESSSGCVRLVAFTTARNFLFCRDTLKFKTYEKAVCDSCVYALIGLARQTEPRGADARHWLGPFRTSLFLSSGTV